MIWWFHCGCTSIVTWAGYFAQYASGTLAEFAQFALVLEGDYFLPGRQIFCKHIPGMWQGQMAFYNASCAGCCYIVCCIRPVWAYHEKSQRSRGCLSTFPCVLPHCSHLISWLHFQLDSVVFAKQMVQGRSCSWRTAVSEHQLMQYLCYRGQEQGYD